jgi:hypothetical protein
MSDDVMRGLWVGWCEVRGGGRERQEEGTNGRRSDDVLI